MNKTPLHIAVENEYFQIVELLLSNDKININCLCKIEKGNNERYAINYSCDEKAALHICVQKRNKKIVNLLLQNQNIDINMKLLSYYKSNEGDFLCESEHESKREKTALLLAIEENEIVPENISQNEFGSNKEQKNDSEEKKKTVEKTAEEYFSCYSGHGPGLVWNSDPGTGYLSDRSADDFETDRSPAAESG